MQQATADILSFPSTGAAIATTPERPLASLTWTALRAVGILPPLWADALLGHPWTWAPPHRHLSEFRILDPRELRRAVDFLLQLTVPGFAASPWPELPDGLDVLFWRPSRAYCLPDPDGDPQSFPGESWYFVNGVGTDDGLVELNAALVSELFRRPLTVVHNATNSLLVDLLECAAGKSWRVMSEPSRLTHGLLAQDLCDDGIERVVVICHSQGTIIVANALAALCRDTACRALYRDGAETPPPRPTRSQLAKLEIYAFANCADRMEQIAVGSRPIPRIESFGNGRDIVARLGMLAPDPHCGGIRIDGRILRRPGAWGHLLNEHYLYPVADHLAGSDPDPFPPAADDLGGPSRLYGYFHGGNPLPGEI